MRNRQRLAAMMAGAIGFGAIGIPALAAEITAIGAAGETLYRVDAAGQRLASGDRTKRMGAERGAPSVASPSATLAGVANSGLFQPYVASPTGSWPEAVAIGDVSGDGRNDVVLVTSYYFDPANDYKLFVFLQNADGSLAAPVVYATRGTYTARPISVAIGDLNSDGLADVAVGYDRSSIDVFLQDGHGRLQPGVNYPTPYATTIQIGDVNHDGRHDVVGLDWSSNNVAVFLQNASGTLDPAATYYAPHGGYNDLQLGDVNTDGRTDIVVMSGQGYAYPNLAVVTQNPAGGFDPTTFYNVGTNILTGGVGIGDVDGDGREDVVVSYGGNRPTSYIGVFRQNISGMLDPVRSYPSYDIPEPVEISDVNGDGRADVLVLHGGWNAMGVYLQQPDGALGMEERYSIPYASHYGPQGIAVGDINGDFEPDVVIADYNHGLVVLRHTPASADLSLTLTDEPDPLRAFETLTYRVSVANGGPSAAKRVSVIGTLPETVTFVSASSDCTVTGAEVSCVAESLAAGSGRTFELLVRPNQVGTLFFRMAAQSVATDPNPGNNVMATSTTVTAPNQPPIAVAGPDQTVKQRTTVTLDGGGSYDPDGTIVAYKWHQTAGSPVTLHGANTASPTFVAPRLPRGVRSEALGFALIVTDNEGADSLADSVTVFVTR